MHKPATFIFEIDNISENEKHKIPQCLNNSKLKYQNRRISIPLINTHVHYH